MYKPIFSFAPMEGITGYPFRNTFHTFFPEVNRYYTPFLSANESFVFTGRERRDVEPSNNPSIDLIPQIITSNAEMFVFAIEEMTKRGYREVNLNLGCPYRTVVAKGKGSGMLRDPNQLDDFFESCFQMIRQKELHVALSIKTRIGIRSAEEFPRLISVFNHYSFKNIIVHPRLQHDFYKNSVNMDAFHALQSESRSPVSYNGDLNSVADLEYLLAQEPSLPEVMLGRGLLRNPALLREFLGGPRANTNELKEYVAALYNAYDAEMDGDVRNILFKMKEFWSYLSQGFSGGERAMKEIRKAQTKEEYRSAVRNLFASCTWSPEERFTLLEEKS